MRRLICPAFLMFCMSAHADPKIQMTPGVHGGVFSTQITTTMLTDNERMKVKNSGVMMASAEVFAGGNDITINRGQHGTVRSSHSVCFETWLTTEADYKFTLDIGGRQVVVSDHIVIPNDRKTCVQHELYQDVMFNSPGSYIFSAMTSATTQMAGEKRTEHRGTISVR